MKKNFFSKRIVIITSITAAFVIGMFGGKAIAAESYQVFTPKSYGTLTFDDGDASNNNGHDHDLMIDTSDLIKLSENADCLANTIDEINTNLGGCRIEQEGNDFYIIGADAVRKKLGSATITKLGSRQITNFPSGVGATTGSASWTVPEGTTIDQIIVYIENYRLDFDSYYYEEYGGVDISADLKYQLNGTTLTATVKGHYDPSGYHATSDWRLYPTLNAIIVN